MWVREVCNFLLRSTWKHVLERGKTGGRAGWPPKGGNPESCCCCVELQRASGDLMMVFFASGLQPGQRFGLLRSDFVPCSKRGMKVIGAGWCSRRQPSGSFGQGLRGRLGHFELASGTKKVRLVSKQARYRGNPHKPCQIVSSGRFLILRRCLIFLRSQATERLGAAPAFSFDDADRMFLG